jgi:hypothetical protein
VAEVRQKRIEAETLEMELIVELRLLATIERQARDMEPRPDSDSLKEQIRELDRRIKMLARAKDEVMQERKRLELDRSGPL